jgi:hypothetical protein
LTRLHQPIAFGLGCLLAYRYTGNGHAGVAEFGRRNGLEQGLSARRETDDAELLKVGGT